METAKPMAPSDTEAEGVKDLSEDVENDSAAQTNGGGSGEKGSMPGADFESAEGISSGKQDVSAEEDGRIPVEADGSYFRACRRNIRAGREL